MYKSSKFNSIINIGTTIVIVAGLIKKPNNVILSNIRFKKVSIPLASSDGKAGRLIQPKTILSNPNIKLNVRGKGLLNTSGKKYKNVMKKANEILSLFKLIISKNNENYVENGTITKIEHRYFKTFKF